MSNRVWAEQKPIVKFGLVTDLHYAEAKPKGTRYYPESCNKLKACLEIFEANDVNFVVELGDFKDQDTPPVEQNTLAYLQKVEQVLQQFNGPVYHVLGNHDMDNLSKTQFMGAVTNTEISRDKTYYSFEKNGIHFIVLDANFRKDGMAYDHGNYDWTDANIPPQELEWLQNDLNGSQHPVIVFCHQLLDGEGSVYVKNAAQVRSVLEQSKKVLAVFQGHHHPGQINTIATIPYYTLKAVVEGSGMENNACAVVEVYPNLQVGVKGYFRAVSM